MKKNIFNLIFVLTLSISISSFAQDDINIDEPQEQPAQKVDIKGTEKSVIDDQHINFTDFGAENTVASSEPALSGFAYIVSYHSAKEIYILAPSKSNKSGNINTGEHGIFKVSLSGFNHLNVDFTNEEYSELFNFVFDSFTYPLHYKIVKTNLNKEKGDKDYEVTLASKKVKNLNKYIKTFLIVKHLPKAYAENISWRKQNSFYYRSKALENRVNRKSRHTLWLHTKGRKW